MAKPFIPSGNCEPHDNWPTGVARRDTNFTQNHAILAHEMTNLVEEFQRPIAFWLYAIERFIQPR
jgi:hypothetical protein